MSGARWLPGAGKEVRSTGGFWQPPRGNRGSIWCLPGRGLAAAPDKSAEKPEQVAGSEQGNLPLGRICNLPC